MQILVTLFISLLSFLEKIDVESVELLAEIVWLVRHVFSSWKERKLLPSSLFFCLSLSILLSLQQDCCYVRKTFSPSIPSVKGKERRRRKENFTSFNQFFRGWCSKEIDLNLLHTLNTRREKGRDEEKSQRNRERRGRSNEDEWTGRDLELGLFLPIFFPKQSRVWQSYVTRIKTLSLGYYTFVFNWQEIEEKIEERKEALKESSDKRRGDEGEGTTSEKFREKPKEKSHFSWHQFLWLEEDTDRDIGTQSACDWVSQGVRDTDKDWMHDMETMDSINLVKTLEVIVIVVIIILMKCLPVSVTEVFPQNVCSSRDQSCGRRWMSWKVSLPPPSSCGLYCCLLVCPTNLFLSFPSLFLPPPLKDCHPGWWYR